MQEEKLREISAKRKEEQEAIADLQEEIRTLSGKIEQGKNEIIQILNQRASTKGKMQRYDAMLEQIGIRKAALSQRILKLKSEESEQEEIIRSHQTRYQEISGVMDELSRKYRQAETQVEALRRQIDDQMKKLEIGQTAYHREASRLESLKNITERYDGYGSSIRRVMEQKDRRPGIHGVVADLIKTEKKYETAIETALGGSIQNIVTDNEQTAKRLIEFLKKNRYGRATFLPLTNMRKSGFPNQDALREPGVIGVADTLVESGDQYRTLLSQLLGRTLVVDQIDHAIAIGKKYRHTLRIVTLEGESLSPGGSMTGGAFRNSSNLLGRRREIEELEGSVKALASDMEEMQKAIAKNRKVRNELREKLSGLTETLQKHQLEQNTEKIGISQAEARIREIRTGYGSLKTEGREIEAQIQEIKRNSSSIQEEISRFGQQEQEQQRLVEEQQKLLEEKQAQENEQNEIFAQIGLEYAALEQKRAFLRENTDRIRQEEKTLKEELEQILESGRQEDQDISKKEEDIRKTQETIREAERILEEDQETAARCRQEKEAMNARHKSFFARRDELSEQVSLMDKECFRLNSQREKLEERQDTQVDYLWEEYQLTPSQAREYRKEETLDRWQVKSRIGELKEEIRKLGNVNVNAI